MVSNARGRSRLLRGLVWAGALAGLVALAAGVGFYWAFLRDLPDIRSVEDYRPPQTSVVLDREGRRIGEFFVERRELVTLDQIPQHVVRAFVAAEDSTFFEHGGIDYQSILRAAWMNLLAGEKVQGGSTITQQMVKGLLLSPERTYRRKLREMILARNIEQRLTKQEILYLYLNQIYFGHGAYGIAEAARTYFGKSPAGLSVSEAAQLAGLPKAPAKYSPARNPKLAERRRRYVLDRMLEEGYVDPETFESAVAERPELSERPWEREYADAAYFTEEVRRYLFDALGGEVVLQGGLRIETSLDLIRQRAAVAALRNGLEQLDRRQGYRGPERRVEAEAIPAELLALAEQNGLAEPEDEEAAEDEEPESDEVVEETAEAAPRELADRAASPDAAAEAAAEGPAELLRAALAEEPRLGVVTAVDGKGQTARVAFGPEHRAEVHLEDVSWAREPNPRLLPVPVKQIASVFRVGDVAHFALAGSDEPEAELPRVTLWQRPIVQGGLLSLDVESGDVIALVGGYDFEESQFNRVTQALRQPGSAFKPLIYGAALSLEGEEGLRRFTPASIVYDRPKVYTDEETGLVWKPKNYGREFYGPITLRKALAKSINTAAVHLADEVGVGNVIRYARRLGIESELEPSLGIALGTSGVSLLELTRAYAVFPAGGHRVVPRYIHRVSDREGNLLLEDVTLGSEPDEELIARLAAQLAERDADEPATTQEPEEPMPPVELTLEDHPDAPDDPMLEGNGDAPDEDRLIPEEDAYLMTDMLRAVVNEGTGRRVARLGRPLGGKTGTTNDQADAWFLGFSPEIATGVWVGHDEIRFLGAGETGSRAAAPIWLDYMESALADVPVRDFPAPRSIVFARIDRETGLLATRQTQETLFQAFLAGTEPTETADRQRTTDEALRNLREDAISDGDIRLMQLDAF
jgi:penicillin-binding protein 1A